MKYKVYIVYKITAEFTVLLVLKYTSIMITKKKKRYLFQEPNKYTHMAQYNSELDKVKARIPFILHLSS